MFAIAHYNAPNETTNFVCQNIVFLESRRKDVECTFDMLKRRFMILKTGITLHGIEICDHLCKTFCAVHNILWDEYGLEEGWNANRFLLKG